MSGDIFSSFFFFYSVWECEIELVSIFLKKLASQFLNDREIIIEREKILFSQTEEASLVLIVVLQYFLVNYPGNDLY